MPADYSLAEKFATVLCNHKFMDAISHMERGAQALIGDAPSSKGAAYFEYARANKIDVRIEEIVSDLSQVDGLYDCQGFDTTARTNLMRLSMKEWCLCAAFGSKALTLDEIAGFSTVDKDAITPEAVKSFEELGLPNLAKAAALYLE